MTTLNSMRPFGKEMRKEFLFADGYLPLNHGSYGTYPRSVHAAKILWQEMAEERPDWFMRKKYMNELNKCREIVAKAINAELSDCVFVPNATTGVNEVLQSLHWQAGDIVLYFSTVYGACEKTVQYLCDTIDGFKTIKIELDYPISDDDILRLTESTISGNDKIKLVLVDAISSLPGVRFPWERVCAICRKYKIYSLVDAAHAITQIPIDIAKSQPDFFVSNLHKWSYVPRACAVLYARRDLQKLLHAVPIGHGYISTAQPFVASPISTSPEGRWVTEHEWTGTQDWSGCLSVSAAFEFIEKCGGAEKIREYCHELAVKGGQRAAESFGTEVLEVACSELTVNMVNVRLPLKIPNEDSKQHVEELAAQREAMFDRLFERDCFPYPFVMTRRGKKEWWCRYSAQIYLDLDDFEKGTLILKDICEEIKNTDWSKVIQNRGDEMVTKEMEDMDIDPESRTS